MIAAIMARQENLAGVEFIKCSNGATQIVIGKLPEVWHGPVITWREGFPRQQEGYCLRFLLSKFIFGLDFFRRQILSSRTIAQTLGIWRSLQLS